MVVKGRTMSVSMVSEEDGFSKSYENSQNPKNRFELDGLSIHDGFQ